MAITLTEAALRIGDRVLYQPRFHRNKPPEDGIITSVNSKYVFVHFDGRGESQATYPDDLDFVTQLTFECENCRGSGRVAYGPWGARPPKKDCPDCGGTGRVSLVGDQDGAGTHPVG